MANLFLDRWTILPEEEIVEESHSVHHIHHHSPCGARLKTMSSVRLRSRPRILMTNVVPLSSLIATAAAGGL